MWQQSTKQLLDTHLQDSSAVDLCMRYFAVMKNLDSVAQGSGQLPDIAKAVKDMLQGFPSNQFFAKHQSSLWPVMVSGYSAWSDALSSITQPGFSSEDKERVAVFAMARRQFHEAACFCAELLQKDAMNLRSALVSGAVL